MLEEVEEAAGVMCVGSVFSFSANVALHFIVVAEGLARHAVRGESVAKTCKYMDPSIFIGWGSKMSSPTRGCLTYTPTGLNCDESYLLCNDQIDDILIQESGKNCSPQEKTTCCLVCTLYF